MDDDTIGSGVDAVVPQVPGLRIAPPLWRPFAAAVVAVALGAFVLLLGLGRNPEDAFAGSIFAAAFAFLYMLILGIPFAYWIHRIGRFRAWSMALGGFMLGGIPFGLLAAEIEAVGFFGAFGVVGALAFYGASCAITSIR